MSLSLKSVWEPGSGGYIQMTGWPTQHTNVAQVCTSFLNTSGERLFAFADPNTRIVVLRCVSFEQAVSDSPRTHLLVRLILTIGVADLRHEVILLLENEVLNCRLVTINWSLQAGCYLRTRIPRRYAHWVSTTPFDKKKKRIWARNAPVSTFILTTPFWTAVLISSFVEPEPPWKTRNLGECI